MGATVTTNKLAAAFREQSGEICYILFEKTYEKNCYPHWPRFSCHYIGNIEGTMERIFLAASSCESGMLQNRNGSITPEGYIAGWLKELANPVAMYEVMIQLETGKSYDYPISANNRDAAIAALRAISRDDLANAIEAGRAPTLSLWNDSAAVRALCSKGNVWTWLLLKSAPTNYPRDASLGYAPKPAKRHALPTPNIRRPGAHEEYVLVQGEDGAWRSEGWAYSVVSAFIGNDFAEELRAPGGYRKRIKAFRDAVTNAPRLSEATVTVDRTKYLDSEWQRKTVAEIPSAFPEACDNGSSFVIPMTKENCYSLCGLPSEVTTWSWPDEPQALPITA